MRLIDADALNLEYEVEMADDWKTAHEIANVVKYAPTIDAVEVVRCRYCDWWNCETKGCKRNPSVSPWWEDDYCSYGERKD